MNSKTSGPSVLVTDFFPKGYATQGELSYQQEIQNAIEAAAERKQSVLFPPMVYKLDESGVRLHSHLTVWMYGAVFVLDARCARDGQAFFGDDLTDLRICGGEIVGRNDVWPAGVNIRGLYLTGNTSNVRVQDMHMRDLSSNGIGVFGTSEMPARDVWVTDCVIEHCCNRYGDYMSKDAGPEKGSVREDQGLIAFYHVEDFVVRGCRFERSRSDGTHFYRCRRGHFVHNRVYGAQMGGYFLETCEEVLASDNVILDNGSRGVTIERGSRNCILNGNVVSNSGREGLWAPDSAGLIVTSNIFDRNGRKPNDLERGRIWNANITIDDDPGEPTHSPTHDYLVAHNIITTTESQIAAIRIDAEVARGIVVRDNTLLGDNRQILVQGRNEGHVVLEGNV
ncbi:MAG TPA: right-handed parallel beta-helix repeat-containing protein [Candidatus Latescibacteria bacterium]|nr:right-handed parallel beta-helix repeat-containing protein [Candidatus Latescibacterota bacterium]